ncbi:hypothetical protein GA0074692_6047 [Micromonospora pallida]|uniref:Beta/Gamma crystallin n=1 Tax=Micromonospora pallida TaxID=145854 RepID=A0A1C6THB2_9ACTN|nr:hypothetical protein [Micromonospora pallida]SCL40915.1 hypothetical protein GA0074692_6047 [Micromonospora pallida]
MAALTRMRKTWRPVVVGALVLAGLTTAATPAAAATTNRTGLCNKGTGFSATLQFPARGGFSSHVVEPGKCWSITLAGGSTEPVYVYAHGNGAKVFLGSKTIKTGEHNVFRTKGTSVWSAQWWFSHS